MALNVMKVCFHYNQNFWEPDHKTALRPHNPDFNKKRTILLFDKFISTFCLPQLSGLSCKRHWLYRSSLRSRCTTRISNEGWNHTVYNKRRFRFTCLWLWEGTCDEFKSYDVKYLVQYIKCTGWLLHVFKFLISN
jgi:hypothetical protein